MFSVASALGEMSWRLLVAVAVAIGTEAAVGGEITREDGTVVAAGTTLGGVTAGSPFVETLVGVSVGVCVGGSVGFSAAKLVVRVKAGNLEDSLQLHSGQQAIRRIQKLIVVAEILQYLWMNQQRRFN